MKLARRLLPALNGLLGLGIVGLAAFLLAAPSMLLLGRVREAVRR